MIAITLPNAVSDDVRRHIAAHSAAEVAANCEPSGFRILIEVDVVEGATAFLHVGPLSLALGSAKIELRNGTHSSRTTL